MDYIHPYLPSLSTLTSLLVPVAYLTILTGSLATFSHIYRQRKHRSKLNLSPYFPPHTARNIYLTLLHQSDTQADLKHVPNSVLMAALQERAVEDILRIRDIQTRKQPLNTLLQRGVVGDDIWQRLLRAEQELEAELKDVVAEANALATGWGTHIFQSANEIVVNRMTMAKIDERRAGLAAEKDAWHAVREASRRELEGETDLPPPQKKGSLSSVSVSGTNTNESTPEKVAPRAAQVAEGSDEDAVMVETPGADGAAVPSTPDTGAAGGGGKKKKKGKK